MEVRKLVKSGPASYALSLPKRWLDKYRISKGDLLYLTEGRGGTLTVSPTVRKRQAERPCCEIDARDDAVLIRRKIISGYVDNCDTITIAGALPAAHFPIVKGTVDELAGLEIMLHTPKQILIRDMLNVEGISIRDNVRKMDVVLQLMFEDLRQALQNANVAQQVEARDTHELNKLYFLTFRLIKLAIDDPERQQQEEFDNFHLISHLRLIVIIEDMGDQVKAICAMLEQVPNRKIPELMSILQVLEAEYRTMIAAYYKRDREAAYQYYLSRRSVPALCDAYAAKNRNLSIAAVLQKFTQLSKLTEDISKIIRYL